ncbi:MAG: hypothetical protein HYW48_11520 [Deltaproteobacteria bacterium]|nr:hypothetical protein [Deltaproteobacteria bacterium]
MEETAQLVPPRNPLGESPPLPFCPRRLTGYLSVTIYQKPNRRHVYEAVHRFTHPLCKL